MFIVATAFLTYFLVVLAERALVEAAPHDIEILHAENSPAARRALSAIGQIKPALAALLLSRLFLKVLCTVLLAAMMLQSAEVHQQLYRFSLWSRLPGFIIWGICATILATALGLAFFRLKQVKLRKFNTVSTLKRMGGFILFWKKIFSWFIKTDKKEPELSNQSLNSSKDSTIGTKAVEEEKKEMELLKSIVRFADVTVKQVMQPRSKIIAVSQNDSFHKLLTTVRESEFSRLPVFGENLDAIKGILYVKDLLPYIDQSDDFNWQILVHQKVFVIPESKHGIELLEDFKKNKVHMAIVIDEFGGTEGIVTLEDILEEVTGDIQDEFDDDIEPGYRQLDSNNWLIDGHIPLQEVCHIIGINLDTFEDPRGNSDTLAGLAIALSGDLPDIGEELTWKDYKLTVVAADERRITQLKLTLLR